METRKVRILLDVLAEGSMLRAAEKLDYTPSGLAHLLDSLEDELGLKLVSRGRFGVRLTAAGEILYPRLQELVQAEENLRDEIDALRRDKRAVVRFGLYESIARTWLPPIMSGFMQTHPEIEVKTVVDGRDELYEALRSRELDVIFASPAEEGHVRYYPLREDAYRAILPSNHPAANGDSFPLAGFARETFIMPSFGCDRDIMELLSRHGITIHKLSAYAGDTAVIGMVEHGLGVSILPELILDLHAETFAALPLDPPVSRTLGIATRKSDPLSKADRLFIRYLEAHLPEE